MQREQTVSMDRSLKADMLSYRILSAKKRETQLTRNKAYNERPRLRSELHH